MDEKLESLMRAMAWERAKGELQSMLHTFHHTDKTYSNPGQWESLENTIMQFIREVENNALQE